MVDHAREGLQKVGGDSGAIRARNGRYGERRAKWADWRASAICGEGDRRAAFGGDLCGCQRAVAPPNGPARPNAVFAAPEPGRLSSGLRGLSMNSCCAINSRRHVCGCCRPQRRSRRRAVGLEGCVRKQNRINSIPSAERACPPPPAKRSLGGVRGKAHHDTRAGGGPKGWPQIDPTLIHHFDRALCPTPRRGAPRTPPRLRFAGGGGHARAADAIIFILFCFRTQHPSTAARESWAPCPGWQHPQT